MFSQFWQNNQYFNPKQVGAIRLWLDATDPSANGVVPADGTSVSSWVDKALTNTVTQATGSKQPVFKTNIINGKSVIRFDGVDDFLLKASATTLGIRGTMFAVGTTVGNTDPGSEGRGTFADYSTAAATNTGMNLLSNGTPDGGPHPVAGFFNTGVLHQAVGATTLALPFTGLFSAYCDGTNGYVLLNGTQDGTVAAGNITGSPNQYTIGSLFGSIAGWFLNGDIGEIIFYAGQVAAAQQTLINRYLGNKWGITVP